MAPTWLDVRRRLRVATIREAVLLALLYAVPQLRRLRRWYWRGVLAAGLVGGAIGLVAAYRDRGRPASGRARVSD
jgi:hypothetical protein